MSRSELTLHALLEGLRGFSPTLVGTYPLGLQIESSDLDIACSGELSTFETAVRALCARAAAAEPRCARRPFEPEASVVQLACAGLRIELFCQALPVSEQAAFRHMLVEGQLLVLGGDALRTRIVALKRAGLKTEPAFAQVLGLEGDPYAALLALSAASQDELRALLMQTELAPRDV